MRGSMRGAMVVLAASAAWLSACDTGPKRDAQTVVAAITRFRMADNTTMPAMLEALKATPCGGAEACKTRDDCIATGESSVKALRLKAEVEQAISAMEKGTLAKDSTEAQELPSKLDVAEMLLKQGFDGLSKCDEQVQALKRKYRF